MWRGSAWQLDVVRRDSEGSARNNGDDNDRSHDGCDPFTRSAGRVAQVASKGHDDDEFENARARHSNKGECRRDSPRYGETPCDRWDERDPQGDAWHGNSASRESKNAPEELDEAEEGENRGERERRGKGKREVDDSRTDRGKRQPGARRR